MDFPSRKPGGDENQERFLRWHFLGGNNKTRIGMNSGLCEYSEISADGTRLTRRILFDAGAMTADPRHPEDPALAGCDMVIPDIARFLIRKSTGEVPAEMLDAIFLTHNHSDHINAIPLLVLMGYQLPRIYATPYTAKRLEQELANTGLDPAEWPVITTIAPGKPVQEGPVSVSAFWVSHSTPQSVGFFIETPEGNILNPGDFKMDQSVIWGPAFNEDQFRKIVSKPVDVLLLDSTGADHDVEPTTEEDVRETLRTLMEKYPGKRFIVATMGGFEENLASVAKVAAEYERTVWIAGWSHEQSLSALQQTGMTLSDSIGQDVDLRILSGARAARDFEAARARDSLVIVTGAQGSPNAALTRAAEGAHPQLQLDPAKDIVLFCAPVIPGQEAQHARLMGMLRGRGIKTITRKEMPLYSQAHARQSELVEMAALVKAKTVVPIHGDTKLRTSCRALMEDIGQPSAGAENGDAIDIRKGQPLARIPCATRGARLIGFKTLQGTSWNDRCYLMKTAPAEKPAVPDPSNSNNRKRPKIFNINPQ